MKKYRALSGQTQEEVAVRSGYSKRRIEQIEAGEPVSLEALTAIAEVIGAPVRELIRLPTTGDRVLGQEWNLSKKQRQGRLRVAANGLHYEVFKIASNNLAGRYARAKLYDTSRLVGESQERTQAILGRHPLICHRLRDVPQIATHVTTAHDAKEHCWWILDEWVAGDSLSVAIKKGLTIPELRHVVGQVALALDALHQQNIIRRVLDPDSVILGEDGRVVVTDFETGKLLEGVPTVSPTGRWKPSPWLAPEVAAGAEAGPYTDWYSWGLLFLHGAIGRVPKDYEERILAIDGLDLPDAVQALVRSCIALRPSERPTKSKVVLRALKAWR